MLFVRFATGGHHGVLRERELARLQVLLQQGLGVLARSFGIDGIEHVPEQRAHHPVRGLEAAIEKYRADYGLYRVGQYRRPARATALQLAFAEAQLLPEVELERCGGKRWLVDDIRA
ncbi:hypothetical protein D3C83_31760 [compost metagenome]